MEPGNGRTALGGGGDRTRLLGEAMAALGPAAPAQSWWEESRSVETRVDQGTIDGSTVSS